MKKPERQTYILTIIRERGAQMGSGEFCYIRFLFAYTSISLRPPVVKTIRLES